MIFKLVFTALVLAVSNAAEAAEGETKEAVIRDTSFPETGWGITDWALGVFIGVYGPLNARAREDDCFSAWYTWGVSTVELSDFFNKRFDNSFWRDYLELIIKLGQYGYETYLVPAICVPELEWNKANPWN